MNYDFLIESISSLKSIQSIDGLKEALTDIIQKLGFQQFAYGRLNKDMTPTESIYTYSDAWRLIYFKKGYQHIDPVFSRFLLETEPFFWSAEQYMNDARLVAFFQDANRYGIYQGITVPLKSVARSRAILTCSSARSEAGPSSIAKSPKDLIGMRVMAEIFHQKAIEFSDIYDYHLKPREDQVLTLSALGFTSEDIAVFLDLNKYYIHEIIGNALNRLGGRNKVSTILRAKELGLIK